ncbi:MAG: hypothetical protein E7047_09780 [Lentisphaerae bacterium]|nr:hypothetical protein [Lentisphaerota bacterium]
MKKFGLSAAVVLLASAAAYGEVEISVNSTPALPSSNFILQSDFADANLKSWIVNKAAPGLVSVGDGVLKLTGNPAESPNVYHRLRLQDGFKKGEPYYISFRAKRSGGIRNVSGGTSLCFDPSNGGKPVYSQTPEQPKYDYDWTAFSCTGNLPIDGKLGTFYLCYYKQQGAICFDDLVFKYGSTDLNISVKGGGLQSITVRNSITGVVLKENISGSEYSKTLKVPAFGSYSVEVFDRTGEATSVLYPANEDTNVAASDTVIPVTPIKRLIMAPGTDDKFVFFLPEVRGKKVYLQFRARCDRKQAGPGGYANSLMVKVNGKNIGVKNVVLPGQQVALKRSPKKVVNIANKNGFVVFFCNSFMTIPADNGYFPVTYKDNNPWDFKLDITSQIESDGLNLLDLRNSNSQATVIMEDLRVVVE